MRCRQCDYPLWTIAARSCPECGAAFAPSEYEFRRGAVQFRCPHCRQEYYGTSPTGHLEPNAFDCVRCGAHITMDEMVLEPADKVGLEDTTALAGTPNPWCERGKRNFIGAWWRSTGALLSAPSGFGASLPEGATLGQAAGYWAISMVAASLASLCCCSPFLMFSMGIATAMTGRSTLGVQLLVPLIISIVFVPFSILVAQGVLAVTGGTHRGMRRTAEVMLYANGAAMLLSAIPCLGGILAIVWWTACAIGLLMTAQRVSGGRAALASLPSTLTVFALMAALVLLPFWIVTRFAAMPLPAATPSGSMAPSLFVYGVSMGAVQAGQWPATPLHAVADGWMQGGDLLEIVSPPGTAWGGGRLTDVDVRFGAGSDIVRAEGERIRQLLPPNGEPFRLGNAVFTYRGLPVPKDFSDGSINALWIVILVPTDPAEPLLAMSRLGPVEIAPEALDEAIAAQNALRSAAGAPPLADPRSLPDLWPAVHGE